MKFLGAFILGPGWKQLQSHWKGARLAAMILAMIAAGYVWFQYRPPVEFVSLKMLNGAIFPGEYIVRDITVVRHKRCQTAVEIVILDGRKRRFIITRGPLSPGPVGRDNYKSRTLVPVEAEAGEGEFRLTLKFYCNWLHRVFGPIIVFRPPQKFTIKD